MIWLGELIRMVRASFFLTKIENRISAVFSGIPDVLSWENWLRTKSEKAKRPQMIMNYVAIFIIFFGSAIASIVLGNVKIYNSLSLKFVVGIDIVEIIVFMYFMLRISTMSLRLAREYVTRLH